MRRHPRARAAFALAVVAFLHAPARAQTPVDFTIAFIGDQGLGPAALDVLILIQSEGADAVVHSGDFDYVDDPLAWDSQINAGLGADFPYFASIGNHDTGQFGGPGGYQELLQARMIRLGIPWSGDLGVKSSLVYGGIHIVLTAPDVSGVDHDHYIRDTFAASTAPWRISSWHKNMRLMQLGNKHNEAGWEVYEASRRGGAIIATAHEHSYSRTHLLSDVQNQGIASTLDTLVIRNDDPSTPGVDEGTSFVFVSGLGGRSIRDQHLSGPWWASVYTSDQNANYGALFGVFNAGGDPTLAHFYFKSIDGVIADDFYVSNAVGLTVSDAAAAREPPFAAELQPNPLRGKVSVVYTLVQPQSMSLFIYDVRGRLCFAPFTERLHAAGAHRWDWNLQDDRYASGVYFLRLTTPQSSHTLRAIVLE
jgi:hypothetical protein